VSIRALTLQDVFAQLAGAANAPTAYDPNTVINSFAGDYENLNLAAAAETWTTRTGTDYPLNLIQDAGPSAYWRLDDPLSSTTVFDSSPFATALFPKVPLTVAGTVTFQSAGAMTGSKSATFNGTTGYAAASSGSPLAITGDFAAEAWVKPASLSTISTVLDKGGTAGEFGVAIQTNGSVTLTMNAGTGTNIIDANTSDIETSAAGWAAGPNTTVAQSTAQAHTGTHSLAMTATTAGACSAVTAAKYAVTAGATYTTSCWIYTPATGRQCYIEVDFYNASSVYIGFAASPTLTLTQNAFTQISLTATAPAGAAFFVLIMAPTAVNSGEVFYGDTIGIAPLSGSSTLTLIPSGSVTTGTWQHIAVTRSAVSMTATGYLNGVAKTTSAWTGAVATTSNAATLGATAGTASHFFNGSIDEVAVYDRVLSAAQVASRVAWATAPDCTSTGYGAGTYGSTMYPLAGSPTDSGYGSAATWGGPNPFYWG
jgi:hypothetical protein